MNLNFGIVLTVIKIIAFLGLGVFMLVVGDRLDIAPVFRIIWGVVLILFGIYRCYWLYKELQVGEDSDDEKTETPE